MAKKYSFHCKNCGRTELSDDKEVVRRARDLHKAKKILTLTGEMVFVPRCVYVPTSAGTLARPDLADILDERRKTDG